jgi:hypothetical protein
VGGSLAVSVKAAGRSGKVAENVKKFAVKGEEDVQSGLPVPIIVPLNRV